MTHFIPSSRYYFRVVRNFTLTFLQKVGNGRISECTKCVAAPAYCGLRGQKYPDKRAMGYPFDRPTENNINTIDDFLTSNMNVIDVKIVHKTLIVQGDTVITNNSS